MRQPYDFIIIGSGFGGSVSALRLSQKGYKVLVIEKGKWYRSKDFPKTNWNLKKWLWIPPLKFFGIMKMTIFKHVSVLSGVGVGGGSLVYANTLPVPKSEFFNSGNWQGLANWEKELKPHYQTALQMLGATKNPKLFDGDLALKDVAERSNQSNKFDSTDVAVFFGKPNVTVPDPYFNGEGPDRAGCSFCGSCMTGCRHNAKNTLDKNYLFLAQKEGAEIMAEKRVTKVFPINSPDGSDGYEIHSRSSTTSVKKKEVFRSKGVIFSGGVLGTVSLLLKLKESFLPNLSDSLGLNIRTNNETLISATTLSNNKNLSKGVAIGSILHADENSHLEVVRYGEGSGFWKFFHLPFVEGRNLFSRLGKILIQSVKSPLAYARMYWTRPWAKNTAVLLFMQTLDSTLQFKRNRKGKMISEVSQGEKPTPFIPESIELTREYCKSINGKPTSFMMETFTGIPSTAHILGGAVMGKNDSEGVIDKNNKVFNYENMYVVDGSMISANPGVNPSLSITAIAEMAMDKIPNKEN